MKLESGQSLLDLACGQGVLARTIPKGVFYTGVDLSEQLVAEAKKMDTDIQHHYVVKDITRPLELNARFSWVAIVLALQNVTSPFKVIANARKHLDKNGKLVIVLNHPAFRIPQYSSWEFDKTKNIQYRRIDGYLQPKTIGIVAHPGKKVSDETVSFHYPLSSYIEFLHDNGMVLETMEEWVSDKKSEGGRAKAEDIARSEFPLFMLLVAHAE